MDSSLQQKKADQMLGGFDLVRDSGDGRNPANRWDV